MNYIHEVASEQIDINKIPKARTKIVALGVAGNACSGLKYATPETLIIVEVYGN